MNLYVILFLNTTFKIRSCVRTILEHPEWKNAMRTSHPSFDSHGEVVPETPMRLLIKIYPDLAEMVFDNCITKSKQMNKDQDQKLHSPKTIVTMNYEFLDDAFYIKSPKPDEKGTFYISHH